MPQIKVSKHMTPITHSKAGNFFIPDYIEIDNKKYTLTSNLSNPYNLPRGGFGLVIFYNSGNKGIAIKFININKLYERGGERKVKKALLEVNLLKELQQSFKKDLKCKNSIVNFIDSAPLEVNNHKYLLIILDKMDMDLADYLIEMKHKHISLNNAKKIMRKISYAIKCLHKIGIIYNDLKPDNVLINSKNVDSQLTDFNCILKVKEEFMDDKKYTGCSTESFRSPEQVETAVSYDKKTDSWQLGILFLCILQKNHHSFISELSHKSGLNKEKIITNINKKIINQELQICKKKYRELNKEKEYYNLQKLIFGLLEINPRKRWNINKIINSDFVKDIKKKTTKIHPRQNKRSSSTLKKKKKNKIK